MHLFNWSSVAVSTSIKAEVLSVCLSGAFRCVLTQCQGGKTSALCNTIKNKPRAVQWAAYERIPENYYLKLLQLKVDYVTCCCSSQLVFPSS